jgi:hypothetical protein
VILPSIKLAVDLHIPFGNEAHKRKRIEHLPEQKQDSCEKKCLEGPNVRDTQMTARLIDQALVSEGVVGTMEELHKKLASLEIQQKKITRRIEETAFLFNRQCDYLQNCFGTPPKDPIVPIERLLSSPPIVPSPEELTRLDRINEYYDGQP